jgi:hypothetical protein
MLALSYSQFDPEADSRRPVDDPSARTHDFGLGVVGGRESDAWDHHRVLIQNCAPFALGPGATAPFEPFFDPISKFFANNSRDESRECSWSLPLPRQSARWPIENCAGRAAKAKGSVLVRNRRIQNS